MKIIKSTRSIVPLFMLALCIFILLFPLANGLVKAQGVSAATPVKKTVLVMFPYQIDLPVSMIATQAIREEFGNASDLNLEVHYEYLDLNRFPDPAYQQQLLDLYKAKYQSKQVDLVMVGSELMLNLWLAQRAEILPDTPIVFFDITTERLNALELPSDVTGVSGVEDYTKSVQWVLDKLPAINEVVIVHGVGQVDQGFIQPFQTLQEKMKGRIKFTDLSNLPLSEIKQRVAELPKTSIVLYHLMFEDVDGNRYRPIDVLRELTAVSSVPVISGYGQFIGTGSIGGYMYSIDHQARDAAQIGLRILRGEAAGVIPIEKDRSNRFIFDHLALQRFDIPISLLPADSVIKNRQYSTWELYRTQIILVSVSFVLLLMLVAFLGAATQRLNKARSDLKRLNAKLNLRILEVENLQAELREQAIRDSQTGLFNRRYLDETLAREIVRAERGNSPLSIIMSDIDLFKTINDTYGHPVGDKFIVEIASLMKKHARSSDIVCRYGGEEFLLVLPGTTLDAAEKRAEELRQKCAEIVIQHEGKDLKVTMSFGVATYPDHGKEWEEIITKADKALYRAKAQGRNCTVRFE